MAPASKDKLVTLIITIVSSLIAAGGGSFVVNNDLLSRVAVAETRISTMESDGNKVLDKLEKLEDKIEQGNKFVRDEIGPDITELKVDVAVLKARQ